jgi:hypothetical protein
MYIHTYVGNSTSNTFVVCISSFALLLNFLVIGISWSTTIEGMSW